MRNKKNPYLPFIFAVVLVAGIALGYIISLNTALKTPIGKKVENNKMESILNYVHQKYVDTVDVEKLEEKAINEMLSSLDPHSFYIPPADLTNVNDDMRGNFEGVGVQFFIVDDTITIVDAIAGGPSEAIGIMAGDKIIMVNDSVVAGVGVKNADVAKMLKGAQGTKVKVTMLRQGEEQDFEITRAKIPLYSVDVSYMLDKQTGIIKINKFSGTTYDEFYNAIKALKRQGLENLIIDLRQNGGGYLRTAVFILDELLAGKKMVVYTEGEHYEKEEYTTNRPGEMEEGKIVVLVDENSASASEILSGALQDWDRALIIGRRTFGKGLVQEQFEMADRSALRLTVARYFIPSGRSIQKPYSDESNYHTEVYKRYENGELFADSIHTNDTTVYYTKIKKRKMYGGGGIFPDIFIPLDTIKNNRYANRLKAFVPEFVYSYYSSHSKDFNQYNSIENYMQNFNIDQKLWQDFLQFAESKKWKKDMSKMAENKKNIQDFMKVYFAKQLFQNDGFYRMVYQEDKAVKEALKQINENFELK